MNNKILLGGLPIGATVEELMKGEMTLDQAPKDGNKIEYYPLERQDITVNQDAAGGGGTSDAIKVAEGDLLKTDESGEIVNNDGGEKNENNNAGNKSNMTVPLIIGGAALFYFLFLRKKN